jgi:hypothetical protein
MTGGLIAPCVYVGERERERERESEREEEATNAGAPRVKT